MAIDFPASPTPGQVYQGYYWDDTKGAWRSVQTNSSAVITSPTTPSGATAGDLWFNTVDGNLFIYYDDGISTNWVEVNSTSSLIGPELDARIDSLEATRTSILAGTTNIPGSILQVVSKTDTTAYASGVSATTWYTWPSNRLATSITPKFSTSKILIIVNVALGNSSNDAAFRITRNGSAISIGDAAGSRPRATGITGMLYAADQNHTTRMVTTSFLDSPATTSTTNYNVDYMSEGTTMYLNRVASYPDANTTYAATVTSTVTLMEVAQ